MSKKEKNQVIKELKTLKYLNAEDKEKLIIEFSDGVYNEEKDELIKIGKKGFYCSRISERLFDYLNGFWINTHCIYQFEENKLLVHKVKDVPLKITITTKADRRTAKKNGVEEDSFFNPVLFETFVVEKDFSERQCDEIEVAEKRYFNDVPYNRVKQSLIKANSVLKGYFARRGLDLYKIDFYLGFLDNKPVLAGPLSPDEFIVKDIETGQYMGKEGVILNENDGKKSYQNLYEILFAEEYQPAFERIKVQDDYGKSKNSDEFEDDVDLNQDEFEEEFE